MSVQVTGILNPFGQPIRNAIIRITSTTNNDTLKNSTLVTCTDCDGVYNFALLNGVYLLEYKQKNAFTEVGYVYVNDQTSSPISITELITSTPLVEIPDATTDVESWEDELALHEADASLVFDINQAVSREASSADYEEASSTETSTLARSLDTVETKLSKRVESITSFTNGGDTFIAEDTTITAPTIAHTTKRSIYEDATPEYSELTQVSTESVLSTERVNLAKTTTGYTASFSNEITSDYGYKSKTTTFNQNTAREVIKNEETNSFGLSNNDFTSSIDTSHSISSSYLDDESLLVEAPKIVKSYSSTISGDTNLTIVEEGTEQYITGDNNSYGSWFKKLTTYTKEAIDSLTNDGFTSIKKYVVDKFLIGDLLEVNTKTGTVKINGQLTIENTSDFSGDTIFQVFQYSVDGQSDWHDEFAVEDLWRRHNTSTNGYIDPSTWSVPYLLQAQDGAEGDTVYYEYRYSSDNVNWHTVFVDGDVWRQERVIENGYPITEWSTSARIKGADGVAGDTVYIEYQYSIDGVDPWHSNFSTGDHYRRERLVTNGTAGEWTDAAKLVPEKDVDYADGYDGAGMYWIQVGDADFPINWSLARQDFYDHFGKYPVAQDHLTYTTSATNDKSATQYEVARWDGTQWIEPAMIVAGDMLVKGTVTAEHIKAKSLTGGEISSTTTVIAGSGTTQAGMNGYDGGTTATNIYKNIRFWAGSNVPTNAPFKVSRDGAVVMSKATINGNSVFNGSLRIPATASETATGCYITPAGEFYLHSSPVGSRLVIEKDRIEVYEGSTLRVRIGRL